MQPSNNTSNNLSIEAYGRPYTFDLGNTQPARAAVRAYAEYLRHQDHDHVLPVFANLSWVIDADTDPAKGKQATRATHILASLIHPKDEDPYRRFYLSNCITSVYAKTGEKVPEVWIKAQQAAIQTIYGPNNNPKNFDIERAKRAGIAVMDVAEDK